MWPCTPCTVRRPESEPRRPILIMSPVSFSLEGSPTMHQSMRCAALHQRLDHALGAVDRRAFLVAGDQEGDRAAMAGVLGDEALGGRHHRRQAALHVGGAAAIEHAVADLGLERVRAPFLERARWARHRYGRRSRATAWPRRAPPRGCRRWRSAGARCESRSRPGARPSAAGSPRRRALRSCGRSSPGSALASRTWVPAGWRRAKDEARALYGAATRRASGLAGG